MIKDDNIRNLEYECNKLLTRWSTKEIFIIFSASDVEFKNPVEVKNFRHPTFPKNSSFKQLIETKDSRPVFSKGHWRQTLTHSKQPKFARIEKDDASYYYDTDVNDYEQQNFEFGKDEQEFKVDEHVTTELPYVYSTLYYDDFSTSSDNARELDEFNSDQVF